MLPNEVILSATLFPIKYPVGSAVFWTTRWEAVLLPPSLFLMQYPLIFSRIYHQILLQTTKTVSFDVFYVFWFYWICHFYHTYPVINVIFTLSSISSGLLFWSVNHTWMDWNSKLVVFSIFNEWGKIVINWLNCLLRTKVNNTLDVYWQLLLNKLQCSKTTSADSSFGTFFPSLSLSTPFFVLPNSLIVSGVNNSSL